MRKKILAVLLVQAMLVAGLTGCTGKEEVKHAKLDPDNPTSLKVWHYYNGAQQANFDELAEEFNASIGEKEGIYVEGYSQGSVDELEKAISSSLAGEVGAQELPDIFSSYADTAYAVQKEDKLVDMTEYFTKQELSQYVDSYIQEGCFNGNGALYLLPIAKSTEVMMINKTDWEPFARETHSTLDELSTMEGVVEVAERYYNWTDARTPDIPDDGRAFYGRDAMANYMIIGMKQMGIDVFEVKNGEVTLHLDRKLVHRLWENYYIPYMKGYFAAYGKFRSDDVKTGDILAYTGSTSSACYFPDQVETDEASYPVDFIVQDPPVMKGGEAYRVQQGAGMAITKSDEQHEYAASVFLKWFTQKEQNLKFVSASSYMPVTKEANNMKEMDQVLKDNQIEMNEKTYSCLKNVLQDFSNTKFYTTKSFRNGYNVRQILGNSLPQQAAADKEEMDKKIAAGASRKAQLKKYTSEQQFETWYQKLCKDMQEAVGKE